MQKNNDFFDDMAKLASGAAGEILEMRRELEGIISVKMEKLLQKMNLATSEEVQSTRDMISKMRENQEKILKRLDSLEKRLEGLKSE